MNENYVEFMVKKITPVWQTILVYLMLVIGVSSAIFYFPSSAMGSSLSIVAIIAAAAFITGFVLLRTRIAIEYEYLYVGKEMTIDKIMGKAKRKTIRRIDMDRVEMVAPIKSWHLDEYKNRQLKIENYTSMTDQGVVYAMVSDNSKILIEVNDELIKLFKNTIPRKIFTD